MLIRYFSPDGGGEGGGDHKVSASDLLARFSEPLKLAEQLANAQNDNYTLREKNRNLTAERDALKGKQTPDGAVVLTGDDATAWTAYQKLGKPSDLETAVTERDTAKADLAKTRRDLNLNEAAGLYGYKPTVLGKLPGFEQPVSVKDGTDSEGKPIKQAFVTTDKGDVALPDYIKQHYADFEPALIASQQQGDVQQRQPWPRQAGNNDRLPPADPVTAHVNNRYVRPDQKS